MRHPKPQPSVARPGRLERVPIQGQTNGGPPNDAGDSPDSEEGEKEVAETLEGRQREDAPELEEEGRLEEDDGAVVSQRRDKDQLFDVSFPVRDSVRQDPLPRTLYRVDRSCRGSVSMWYPSPRRVAESSGQQAVRDWPSRQWYAHTGCDPDDPRDG